jgi:hypothetical protein
MAWRGLRDRWREARAESADAEPGSEASEAGEGQGEASAGPAPPDPVRAPDAVARLAVWREVLGTWWVVLSAGIAATAVAAFQLGWRVPGLGRIADERWVALLLVLATLVAGVLEGSHRAVAEREREVRERREELERLIRMPQRRLAQAKYHLYRDAFMCAQIVGFLTMARMDASAVTPETALAIERSWGSAFLERCRRMFGAGRLGEVFSQRIGGSFPPPREQATAVYAGLADFLRLMAERITEHDLDPAYLQGRDAEPERDGGEPPGVV